MLVSAELLSWNLQRYREQGWEPPVTFISCQVAFLGSWRGCGFGWMKTKLGPCQAAVRSFWVLACKSFGGFVGEAMDFFPGATRFGST